MSSYQNKLKRYQKILNMPTCKSSPLIFICDTTYTGRGETVRSYNDGTFIEITRAYIDGKELKNPLLGIYALVNDKFLKNVTNIDFEYLFKCSYVVSLANQGKVDPNVVIGDLDELYNLYIENAGMEDQARLVRIISKFITTATPEKQQKFFDEWSLMLNAQIYDISQTIALVRSVDND
jgi:hypothetical protein